MLTEFLVGAIILAFVGWLYLKLHGHLLPALACIIIVGLVMTSGMLASMFQTIEQPGQGFAIFATLCFIGAFFSFLEASNLLKADRKKSSNGRIYPTND